MVENRSQGWLRADWLALLLIVAGFGLALLLVPPTRTFAYDDDWIYTQAVAEMLAGRGFQPPDLAFMTLVAHTWWGAGWCWLFGFSFTTLTWATLSLSLVALLAFYLLLREISYSPALSLLGVAVLGVSPLFVSNSYSYMTDITFLTLLLLSSLCYVRGIARLPVSAKLKAGSSTAPITWLLPLLLASVFASLAFLTRQLGLALPLAALLWLTSTYRNHPVRVSLYSSLAAVALPITAVAGYFLWSSPYAATSTASYQQLMINSLLHNPAAVWGRVVSCFLVLPLLGLTIPLLAPWRWRTVLVASLWLLISWLVALSTGNIASVGDSIPDYANLTLPIRLLDYPLLRWLGLGCTAWLLAGLSLRLERRLSRPTRSPLSPVDFCYLTAAALLAITFITNPSFFPRYFLPFYPALILAGLGWLVARPRMQIVSLGLVLVLGFYSLAAQHDIYAAETARWQAGRSLVAAGVPLTSIDGGWAWDGYYLYAEAIRRGKRNDFSHVSADWIAARQIIDPQYILSYIQPAGYDVVGRYPFFTILNWRERNLLVVKRH